MKTRLIIFDYDGVITDSLPMIREVYGIIAHEFNIKQKDHLGRDFFELDYRKTLKKWNIETETDIEKVNGIFAREVARREEKILPFNGINAILELLHKDYKLAIASNNFKSVLAPALKKNSLSGYFDFIVGLEDGKPKPHPELLLKVMKELACKPSESVFIGDMDGDILAGKAAGLKKTIAVTYGWHEYHRLKDADIIVKSPEDLIEAVI